MTGHPFKAVLFDLEGTLVDFQWCLRDAQQEILSVLKKSGLDPVIFGKNPDYAKLFNTTIRITETWESNRLERLFQTLGSIYDRYDLDALSRWQPYPDTNSTLQKLSNKGYIMGVVSNCGTTGVSAVLEKFHLLHFFEQILSRNDVQYIKPAPDGLILAAKRFGLPVNTILFVGDSKNDIDAANEISMPSCFLTGGESRITGVLSHGESFSISSLRDLVDIL